MHMRNDCNSSPGLQLVAHQMNQSWKARGETLLRQFIDGGPHGHVDNDKSSHPFAGYPHEMNASDYQPTCAYEDSVYDRLLGCTPVQNEGLGCSLEVQRIKFIVGRALKAYLSNPFCLALLPLLIGVCVGLYLGRGRTVASQRQPSKNSKGGGILASISNYTSLVYCWVGLRVAVALMHIVPEKISSASQQYLEDIRDRRTRTELQESVEVERESGVPEESIPQHVAVIMDGNRRYGKQRYGNATRGHWDGSRTLVEFAKWCMAEGVSILTVYAFSTENWDREPAEVAALMSIFVKYCEELRVEAVKRGIRIHVLTTEDERIPSDVKAGVDRMVEETKHCEQFTMNICLSYGGRGEIVHACRGVVRDVLNGDCSIDEINEGHLRDNLLTRRCRDPDLVIRTSGEERISNFLLWQIAYSEFFFLKKQWPELQKSDLIEVIRTYAKGRNRRYGK